MLQLSDIFELNFNDLLNMSLLKINYGLVCVCLAIEIIKVKILVLIPVL